MEPKHIAVSTEIENPILPDSISSLSNAEYFSGLLSTLISLGFFVGMIIFVFMLIIGSVQWITSGGDKSQAESARTRITHASTGLVVLLSVIAIVKLVEIVFGIDILNISLEGLGFDSSSSSSPPPSLPGP